MADISNEVKTIEEAARGEEVRDAIVGALNKINEIAADPEWEDIGNTPVTLAGYGITDAYTKEETDALISEKAGDVLGLSVVDGMLQVTYTI